MNALAYDCGCNLPHGKTVRTVDKLSELSGIFPSGLKALVLSDDKELRLAVSKLYRTESLTLAATDTLTKAAGNVQKASEYAQKFRANSTQNACESEQNNDGGTPNIMGDSTQNGEGYILNKRLTYAQIGGDYAINSKCDYAQSMESATAKSTDSAQNKEGNRTHDASFSEQKNSSQSSWDSFAANSKQSLRARDFDDILSSAKLSEDIRLVISEGEYVPLGRVIASKIKAQHIIIGGGNLSDYDITLCGKAGLSQTPVAAAVKDAERVDLPSGFAFVMCGLLALFDWDISSLLFGEKMCGQVFKQAQKTVSRLLDASKLLSRRSPQLKAEVLQAQLEMSSLIGTKGARLLLSGATQSAAALTMLYRHEEREMLDIFSSAFLLSPTVAKAYSAFLAKEIPFTFPPDPNLRADRMADYLGMSHEDIYPLPPHTDIKKIRLTDYRLSVYREELQKHIYGIIRTLDVALPLYFRLFEDDGYFLKGYIGCLDSSLSIGLGSDVLVGDTLLSYMREKGVLDRYIV